MLICYFHVKENNEDRVVEPPENFEEVHKDLFEQLKNNTMIYADTKVRLTIVALLGLGSPTRPDTRQVEDQLAKAGVNLHLYSGCSATQLENLAATAFTDLKHKSGIAGEQLNEIINDKDRLLPKDF
jgi:hypothetical protein